MDYRSVVDNFFFTHHRGGIRCITTLLSVFCELKKHGFSQKDYTEDFIVYLFDKASNIETIDQSKMVDFKLFVIHYILYFYKMVIVSNKDTQYVAPESVSQKNELKPVSKVVLDDDIEPELKSIPNMEIDWEFMKELGVEDPDDI